MDISESISNRIEVETLVNADALAWKQTILQQYPQLQQLHLRWSQREKKDLKIPPGSQSVNLSYGDPRYVLSLLCVIMSKQDLMDRRFAECEYHLRESYMWCPKSVETLYLLGEIVRLTSYRQESLDEAIQIYRKAILGSSAIINKEVGGDPDILVRQIPFGKEAAHKEALYLLQTNSTSEAEKVLRTIGFKWRISSRVLNYPTAPQIGIPPNHSPAIKVFDDFLSTDSLSRMQHIFRSEGPFWFEHDYDEIENFSRKVGYFSYLYPFRERRAKTFIEQIIDGVFDVMSKEIPDLCEATTCKDLYSIDSLHNTIRRNLLTFFFIAEWWVHSRPHGCGHQMHFDSDETRIDEGGNPQHPIISCVFFVNEAGGPTLMTDQTLHGQLGTEGWMIDAKLNRILAFDARYLHGVIPGVGVSPQEGSRRQTFMVGFWRKIQAKDKGRGRYGAGQPFPFDNDNLRWPREMEINEAQNNIGCNSSRPSTIVRHVSPVWEPLQGGGCDDYKSFFQGF
jgi:hypothetical protein